MGRFKRLLVSNPAFLYFILVMWWVIFLLIFSPLILFSDIQVIRESGFATVNSGIPIIGMLGLLIGLSLLIPAFRRMYYKLPWLFPIVKILFLDVIIMGIAISILNYGYEIQNATRHTVFYVLMIMQIIICRLGMCLYFHKRPVKFLGGESDE